jgi:hypothetical protein
MAGSSASVAVAPPVSAQMDAVLRIMTGREERTIAEKLADSNRPTWEQYKKDNQDKLNLDNLDQKQMDEYRQTLDAERDRRMAGLQMHDSKKDKKKHHKKKKKNPKEKRKRKAGSSSSNSSFDSDLPSDSESLDDGRNRRKHKKRHKRRHKRKRLGY